MLSTLKVEPSPKFLMSGPKRPNGKTEVEINRARLNGGVGLNGVLISKVYFPLILPCLTVTVKFSPYLWTENVKFLVIMWTFQGLRKYFDGTKTCLLYLRADLNY